MMVYQGEARRQEHAYGRLIKIMEHCLYDGGPTLVFAEFEWFTRVRTIHNDRVQIVKSNRLDRWNLDVTGYRFDVLSEISPLPVTFEPLDGHAGNPAGDRELMVVYREAQLHYILVGN
jgi:hypothetical protein